MTLEVSDQPSIGRKLVAGSGMAAAAGLVAHVAVGHWYGVDWPMLAAAGVLALTALGIAHRSIVVAILARGPAWLVFAPTIVATALHATSGRLLLDEAALALSTGVALLASRPVLHTHEARRDFAPRAFRRWLLGGSVALSSSGFAAGFLALNGVRHYGSVALGLVVLAAAFFASAFGVLRMRAWGIFLGALTSTLLLACGLLWRSGSAFPAFAFAAAPALLMHVLPILVARWRGTGARRPAVGPVHVRVATEAPRRLTDAEDAELETQAPHARADRQMFGA